MNPRYDCSCEHSAKFVARRRRLGLTRASIALAVTAGAIALAGCGGASKTYDIAPIFPLSSDKCARYGGDQEGSGPAATCKVTKDECEKAATDWREAMDNRGINDAIDFRCN